MSRYDGSIRINTQIDTSGIRNGESEVRNSLGRMGTAAKAVGAILKSVFIVGAVRSIVQFGKECVELGSDLEEVQNVVDVTFTTMSKKVDEFAKNAAISAGLSETMAKRYVGTFGAMAKSFGFTEQAAYDMATSLTQLSGDVASFYNISQDESYIKLKSVFTGETETLKDLGVVMTQAALDQYALANGFGKTTSAMTEQEKVALRHQFVMQQLSLASGDFIRTSDSWANQVRIMQLQIQSLKATIGQGLINIFTPVIKVINTLLSKLATVANAFKAFTKLITGKKASSGGGSSAAGTELSDTAAGYNDAAGAADNLAESTGKAAKATKEAAKAAKGYLNPLDQINKISEEEPAAPSSSGGSGGKGGGTGIGGGAVDYGGLAQGETIIDKLDGKLNGLIRTISLVKDGFKGAFKANTGQLLANIQRIGEANRAVWGSPEVQAAMSSFKDQAARTLGAVVGSVASVTVSFSTGLTGGIAAAKEDLEEFDKIKIVSILGNLESGLKTIQDFAGAVAEIATAFEAPGFQKIVEILYKISDIIGKIALDWLTGILSDLLNLALKPITDNSDKLRIVLEDIFDIVSILLEPIENLWDLIASKAGKYEDSPIHKFFEALSKVQSLGLGIMLDKIHKGLTLIKDVLSGNITLGEAFKELFNGTLLGKLINNLKGPLITALENAKEKITEFIEKTVGFFKELPGKIVTFFKELPGKISYILGLVIGKIVSWVTNFIKTVKTEVPKIIQKIAEFFKELPGNIWNLLTTAREKIISWVANCIKTAREEVPKIISNIIEFFKELPGKIWEFLTSIPEKIKEFVISMKTKSDEEMPSFIDSIIDFFKDLPENLLEIGKNLIQGLLNGILSAITGIGTWIKDNIIDPFLNGFKDGFGIHSPSTVMAEQGDYVISGLLKGILDAVKGIGSWIKENVIDPIVNKFKDIKEKFLSKGREIISGIKGGIAEKWAEFKQYWQEKKDSIVNKFNDIKEKFLSKGRKIISGIRSGISEKWSEFIQYWQEKKNSVVNKFSDIKEKFLSKGRNIISGIKSGIIEKWGEFISYWQEKKNAIINKFRDIKEKFLSKGREIISGIRSGIIEKWGEFKQYWQEKKDDILGRFSDIKEKMKEVGQNIVNGIIDGIKSIWDTLTGWAKDIADLFTVDVKHSGSGVTTTSGTTTKPKVRTAEYSPYSSSFSEVPIPHLAKGTVIPPNSEFLAVLGDQKHGTNIEAPLDTIKQANRESILEVLSELGITGNRGNNNTQTIVIKQYLDGNQVAESVVKAGRVRQMATGSNMFMLGTT